MERHRISWFLAICVSPPGILILYSFFNGRVSEYKFADFVICFAVVSIFLLPSFWILKKRISGKDLYCDEEGGVVNFKGDKIFWSEIEDIRTSSFKYKTTPFI